MSAADGAGGSVVPGRVKVYQLNEAGQWDDQGTGHVRYKGEDPLMLTIVNEDMTKDLLEHKVDANVDYTRQGDTIITWCEPTTNVDLALSFQEVARCGEVWEAIQGAQAKAQSDALGSDENRSYDEGRGYGGSDMEDAELELGSQGPIPFPDLDNLEEIAARLNNVPPGLRQLAVNSVTRDGFLAKLIDLFHQAEDLEQLPVCKTMFEIFKALFLLNDVNVYERILPDDTIMEVIAALEYDPDLPADSNYTRHRDFLAASKFKTVVELKDDDVLQKIHQNFRITYIKDVILLRYLDDPTLGTLTSMIFFNNVIIISRLTDSTEFMTEFFAKLAYLGPMADLKAPLASDAGSGSGSGSGSDSKSTAGSDSAGQTDEEKTFADLDALSEPAKYRLRKDLFTFLQQLCTLAKTLHPPIRDAFYKTLIDYGVLQVVEDALLACSHLAAPQHWLWLACADILNNILNHDPGMLRAHLFAKGTGTAQRNTLLTLMFSILVDDKASFGLQHQVAQLLKLVLDFDSMESERDSFLDLVYDHHMQILVASLTTPVAPNNVDGGFQAKYQAVELLSFCVQQHQWRVRSFVLQHNAMQKAVDLLRLGDTQLTCSVVRFLRSCVALKDDAYNRKMVQQRLLDPVMQAFLANGARYNLLNSVVIDLVNIIRLDNVKPLVDYLVTEFEAQFADITYVQTFRLLKTRWEQNQELLQGGRIGSPQASSPNGNISPRIRGLSWRKAGEDVSSSEYAYFATDDEDDDADMTALTGADGDRSPERERERDGAGTDAGSPSSAQRGPGEAQAREEKDQLSPGSGSGSGRRDSISRKRTRSQQEEAEQEARFLEETERLRQRRKSDDEELDFMSVLASRKGAGAAAVGGSTGSGSSSTSPTTSPVGSPSGAAGAGLQDSDSPKSSPGVGSSAVHALGRVGKPFGRKAPPKTLNLSLSRKTLGGSGGGGGESPLSPSSVGSGPGSSPASPNAGGGGSPAGGSPASSRPSSPQPTGSFDRSSVKRPQATHPRSPGQSPPSPAPGSPSGSRSQSPLSPPASPPSAPPRDTTVSPALSSLSLSPARTLSGFALGSTGSGFAKTDPGSSPGSADSTQPDPKRRRLSIVDGQA